MCQDPPENLSDCGGLGMVHHMVTEVEYDEHHARQKHVWQIVNYGVHGWDIDHW